jgi:5-methyltetrahydrofolate--homocysteine methyltransferase
MTEDMGKTFYARIDKPAFIGTRVLEDFPLEKLVPYVDWSPFFMAWEMKGKYPAIFDDPQAGQVARELFADAQKLLDRIVRGKLLTARAVYGIYPANNDLAISVELVA